MTTILQARQLNKIFVKGKSNSQHVLRDVDIAIRQGEFVSVMGPSGSGKSTLLYTLSGMDKPSSGSISFGEQQLAELGEDKLAALRLSGMGFVFQHGHLLRNLNILDNIVLPAYTAAEESRRTIRERARELMIRTGIAELADHDITQVSGGQLQRAAICRALINNPDMLFGDEPTGALNSRAAAEVMDILGELNRSGTTILLVTHDAKVAAATERVIFMADGAIAGELTLGPCAQNGSEAMKLREQQLSAWLAEMGF